MRMDLPPGQRPLDRFPRFGTNQGPPPAIPAAPAIEIADTPRFERTLPRAFDAEGVPKDPLPLIQDGVAMNVVHDTRSAALVDGAWSTGHALAPGGSSWGPMPTNLVLIGGGARDEAELCAPIERGVYVTRLWYTNVLRPNETLITGVTRDGTFLIEDGRITLDLPVPLARPRARGSAAFAALEQELLQRLLRPVDPS